MKLLSWQTNLEKRENEANTRDIAINEAKLRFFRSASIPLNVHTDTWYIHNIFLIEPFFLLRPILPPANYSGSIRPVNSSLRRIYEAS